MSIREFTHRGTKASSPLIPSLSRRILTLEEYVLTRFTFRIGNRNRVLLTVQVLQIMLEPGDVLHVPPYWFHHVESITPSGTLLDIT